MGKKRCIECDGKPRLKFVENDYAVVECSSCGHPKEKLPAPTSAQAWNLWNAINTPPLSDTPTRVELIEKLPAVIELTTKQEFYSLVEFINNLRKVRYKKEKEMEKKTEPGYDSAFQPAPGQSLENFLGVSPTCQDAEKRDLTSYSDKAELCKKLGYSAAFWKPEAIRNRLSDVCHGVKLVDEKQYIVLVAQTYVSAFNVSVKMLETELKVREVLEANFSGEFKWKTKLAHNFCTGPKVMVELIILVSSLRGSGDDDELEVCLSLGECDKIEIK